MDNASNNDSMIEHLGKKLDDFSGGVNQTRCFAHTLNLAAKAIIKQFDEPKTSSDQLDDVAQTLSNMALELENDDEGESEDDKALTDSEWNRIREELSDDGFDDWHEAIQPVRTMLFKVHRP
jgi:hypothetical protein